MKLRNEYPIYFEPTFPEILELAASEWDTCRIVIIDDKRVSDEEKLVIASGFGNTHTTLVEFTRKHFQLKRYPYGRPMILYHRNGIAFFNLEDIGGKDNARFERASKTLNDNHAELIKDLIRESDLAL